MFVLQSLPSSVQIHGEEIHRQVEFSVTFLIGLVLQLINFVASHTYGQTYKFFLGLLTPCLCFVLSVTLLASCFEVNVAAPGPSCMGKRSLLH